MLFSSISFLFYFLPVVLFLYFISPKCLKNTVLLLSSLVFYGWGEPKFLLLMLITVFLSYIFGLLIDQYRGRKLSKLFLILSILSSLSGLLYFKYADFFINNVNSAFGMSVPLLHLVLPIGISFYTFQVISYSVDLYRGDVAVQKNPISLATYVALFPQLIAGPIVRYADVADNLANRTHSFDKTAEGIRRFIFGLSKKIIVANTLGELGESFLQSSDLSVLYYWLYAVSYMLQIYFDFSGYSDMAIGLGKLFGFQFMENFNYPFVARSITDFWRRWHISLGSWFRDYVYIPLGGNRVKRPKMLFNIFIVWFLTGFWHGAEWNFIFWGLFFGVLLTLEKFFFKKFLDKHKVIRHAYVLFFVAISFMIFSGTNAGDAVLKVGGMLGFLNLPLVSVECMFSLKNYGFILLLAAVGATPLPKIVIKKLRNTPKTKMLLDVLEVVTLLILLLICTGYLADGSFNPFLYFRF